MFVYFLNVVIKPRVSFYIKFCYELKALEMLYLNNEMSAKICVVYKIFSKLLYSLTAWVECQNRDSVPTRQNITKLISISEP